eukprot:scaffold5092_cov179-Amphora_coffeaeformis.AAC.10
MSTIVEWNLCYQTLLYHIVGTVTKAGDRSFNSRARERPKHQRPKCVWGFFAATKFAEEFFVGAQLRLSTSERHVSSLNSRLLYHSHILVKIEVRMCRTKWALTLALGGWYGRQE